MRGKRAEKLEVVVREYQLNSRQMEALHFLVIENKISIQDYEKLCPSPTRRTLQRDLSNLIDKGLIHEIASAPTDPSRSYKLKLKL